jgi:hypothetical protein
VFAYLFWHRPADPDRYEESLATFHTELGAARLPFLAGSASYRVEGLAWLDSQEAYEDWYLVDSFADLEALNEAAVSARLRAAHDRAALAAGWGAGGLYQVKQGEPILTAPVVTWISKPREVRYPAFYASLPPTPCLLRRQMVLGPAPEFCAFGELANGVISWRTPVFISPGARDS